MNSKRFYFIMLGVTAFLGIAIFGTAFLGNSLLQKQSQKLVGLKLDAKVIEAQQTSLIQAKKDIAKYEDLEKQAKAIIPQDKDQAAAVREIVKIASASGISLSSINFTSSSLGQKTVVKSESGATSTKSTTPPLTQVEKVPGITGLYSMTLTIQSNSDQPVSYASFINFLNRLEQNRRTAHVTGVSISPDAKNPSNLSFNLVVNLYIKP